MIQVDEFRQEMTTEDGEQVTVFHTPEVHVENRAGRTFISQEELLAACPKVSKTHVEQLRDAGALGSMPETSQISLF